MPRGVSRDANLPSSQFVKAVKTVAGQYIPLVNEIINSRNTQKEILIYRFGKHGKKADG